MSPHALHLLVRGEDEPKGVAGSPRGGAVIVIEPRQPRTHHLRHVLRDLLSSALGDNAMRDVSEVADAPGSVGGEARVQTYLQFSHGGSLSQHDSSSLDSPPFFFSLFPLLDTKNG